MKMSCPQLGTYYIQTECLIKNFKGTVSVISSDPSYKDDNARFTTNPLKPLHGSKMWKALYRFSDLKGVYFCKFFHCF